MSVLSVCGDYLIKKELDFMFSLQKGRFNRTIELTCEWFTGIFDNFFHLGTFEMTVCWFLFFQETDTKSGEGSGSSESEQIKTLSESLFTLTQEKSKLEGVYLADKKRLLVRNFFISTSLNSNSLISLWFCLKKGKERNFDNIMRSYHLDNL